MFRLLIPREILCRIAAQGCKESLGHRHHDAWPESVSGGVANGHGEGLIIGQVKVAVIAAHFGSRLHIEADIEVGQGGRGVGQHGDLQLASLLQFLRFALVFRLQQLALHLFLAGAALLCQGDFRQSLNLE